VRAVANSENDEVLDISHRQRQPVNPRSSPYHLADLLRENCADATHLGCEQGVCGLHRAYRRSAGAGMHHARGWHRRFGYPHARSLNQDPLMLVLKAAFHDKQDCNAASVRPNLISAWDLLRRNLTSAKLNPHRDQRQLCRCTGYQGSFAQSSPRPKIGPAGRRSRRSKAIED